MWSGPWRLEGEAEKGLSGLGGGAGVAAEQGCVVFVDRRAREGV